MGDQDAQITGDKTLEQCIEKTVLPSTKNKTPHKVEVKLLKAVRVPGRHGKIVTGSVIADWTSAERELLLDPSEIVDDQKVTTTESLVNADHLERISVLVENHEFYPVTLEAGTTLGLLQPVKVMSTDELPQILHLDVDTVEDSTAIQTCNCSLRARELLNQLDVEWGNVNDVEAGSLKAVIEEFSDVFALDPKEVGHTESVQHKINTGEHPPVKQPPCRIPFSLRKKVEEMNEEMLKNGVIEPSQALGPAQ